MTQFTQQTFYLLKKWRNFDTLKKYAEKTQYFRHIP